MEKQKIELKHSVTGNKLGRSYGFPDFLIGFNWELQEFLAIIQQEREWRIFMAQHEKFYLNGTWQLKKADETLLCPVEIPGSVLSGLTEHGLLEDPFYRMNEYPTRELLKNDLFFKGI